MSTGSAESMNHTEFFADLRQWKALVVHCSCPGKGDEPIDGQFYPDGLKHATNVCSGGIELRCSVIWHGHVKTFGSIGIVLKPRLTKSLRRICVEDAGSFIDPLTGRRKGLGAHFCDQTLPEIVRPKDHRSEVAGR